MKPFDAKAKCPKCGSRDVSTCYHEPAHFHCYESRCPSLSEPMERGTFPEHFERRCRCCGYTWAEAPLDVPKS